MKTEEWQALKDGHYPETPIFVVYPNIYLSILEYSEFRKDEFGISCLDKESRSISQYPLAWLHLSKEAAEDAFKANVRKEIAKLDSAIAKLQKDRQKFESLPISYTSK
jgi:hypothetical protein